jgi:DnaJ family protein A protein 2
LDGKKLTVSSIPGEIMQPNITKTVKGKGMPFFKDSYAYGNLYIKFVVKFPESGSLDKS